MDKRKFGSTGLDVTLLGLGTNHIGNADLDDAAMGRMLNQVLDLGVNLVDTARSYGEAETRIGKYISGRRKEYILSTKVGYDVEGVPNWSYKAVYVGIQEALVKMKTDYIDIIHLHSCDREFLENEEVIDALEKAREEGKVRFIAYSGENEALDYAISKGRFDSVQASVNICDQRILERQLPEAFARNMGFIAKRPLANAVWRYNTAPHGHSHIEYWRRFQKMKPDPHGLAWDELALRFTAFSEGVSTCITGSTSIEHIKNNIRILEKGKLDDEIYESIRSVFRKYDKDWNGLI